MSHRHIFGKRRKKRGYMKKLVFDSYNPADRDDEQRAPAVSRAWILAWNAILTAPSGNTEQTALGLRLYEAFKSLSEYMPNNNQRLNVDGGTIYLTSEEFKRFGGVLERFREQVPLLQADALVYLDDLMKNAPEIKPEELTEKVKE